MGNLYLHMSLYTATLNLWFQNKLSNIYLDHYFVIFTIKQIKHINRKFIYKNEKHPTLPNTQLNQKQCIESYKINTFSTTRPRMMYNWRLLIFSFLHCVVISIEIDHVLINEKQPTQIFILRRFLVFLNSSTYVSS